MYQSSVPPSSTLSNPSTVAVSMNPPTPIERVDGVCEFLNEISHLYKEEVKLEEPSREYLTIKVDKPVINEVLHKLNVDIKESTSKLA
jgi:hypothetical protein